MAPYTLEVLNGSCRLPADTPPYIIKELDRAMAYLVEGHEHAPAFKKHFWDGREHLLKFNTKAGVYIFPAGLLPEVAKLPVIADLQLKDCRRPLGPRREFAWVGHTPRQYQTETVEAALQPRTAAGIDVAGRGLLNLPIRSGKTLMAARIQTILGYRALFVVPSDLLLRQTVNAFKSFLAPAPVGICGAGEWAPDWITVATIQTILANPARAAPLLASADILYVDEAHHLDAPKWREPLLACDARYKIGLSATLFTNKDIAAERSAIWLRAVTGPILHRVSMKQLMDAGFLVQPQILMYPIDKPNLGERVSWQRALDKLLVNNQYRNAAITDLVEDGTSQGRRVLVDTGRKDQMRAVHEMLKARRVRVRMIHGQTPSMERQNILAAFREGSIQALVGTVLGEGVDIPELDMVVNAEGQKSKEAAIQRMRNLTASEGKQEALFIDFADLTHPKLREHSRQRMELYKSMRGFRLRAVPVVDGKFKLPAPAAKL